MKKRARAKQRVLILDDHPMMRRGLAQFTNHQPDLVRYAVRWTERQNAA